jgi:hypothetical protein
MPKQNRVTPRGDLIAVPDRGTFWGNRGALHDADQNLVRYARGQAWIICLLEFKGRRRQLWAPGRLTELFFLDEATGLAAGHRPCAECRNPAYRKFKAAYHAAHPDQPTGARDMDAHLHADRLVGPRTKRTYRARLAELPDGTMLERGDEPWLVLGPDLLAWTHAGYRGNLARDPVEEVTVLTPRATVATIRAGYQPVLHPSATAHRPGT